MIVTSRAYALISLMSLASVFPPLPAQAANPSADNTMITQVAINGGTDTVNAGTTCLQISSPVSAACTSGFIAINKNNKELVSAALAARVASRPVWMYYDDANGPFHCPGLVFTPAA